MKIVTGNDLKTGDVIWWTGSGWSRNVADSVDAGDQADAIAAAENAALRVNVPYVIDAERDENTIRPLHIKERIRALGPTVRLDLAVEPELAVAANWVK